MAARIPTRFSTKFSKDRLFHTAMALAAAGMFSAAAIAQTGAGANPAEGMPAAQQDAPAAQSDIGMDPDLNVDINEALRRSIQLRKPDVNPLQMHTLFYTLWQHSLLQEAKQTLQTRPLGPGESDTSAQSSAPAPGIREISLGGIVYVKADDWTIWLNGVRVTPKAIPKEVLDIHVHPYSVDLKWYDAYTNVIYPVRMRTHQRFNLDSRIFLPGITADAAAAQSGKGS
jgi:hypothetical protein